MFLYAPMYLLVVSQKLHNVHVNVCPVEAVGALAGGSPGGSCTGADHFPRWVQVEGVQECGSQVHG